MSELSWQWARLADLTAEQCFAICAARQAVFVVEQRCAYADLDLFDENAAHLIAWSEQRVAAYLRVLAPGTKFDEPSLGRILTASSHRGTGLGRELVMRGVQYVQDSYPNHSIRISAQQHLGAFYESCGFSVASSPYDEDGIPHVEMLLMIRADTKST
jgi:ElaA protein